MSPPTKPKRLCSSWILAGFLFVKCGTDENFCCSFVKKDAIKEGVTAVRAAPVRYLRSGLFSPFS